jgi:predicted nucleic-acid-binding protein
MRAVDTNVLVRLATGDDPQQTAAAEAFVAKGAWVSLVALAEALWVLGSAYGLNHAQLTATVTTWLDHAHLSLEDSDLVQAALQRYRERPALGFTDCLILELAHKAGHLPLGTFDRKLAKQPGAEQI